MGPVRRSATLLKLAGKVALGGGVLGVLANIYGVVGLVLEVKGDPWMWIAIGWGLMSVSLFSVGYGALKEKEKVEKDRDKAEKGRAGIRAGVVAEGRDGGIGIEGPVRGEYREQ